MGNVEFRIVVKLYISLTSFESQTDLGAPDIN